MLQIQTKMMKKALCDDIEKIIKKLRPEGPLFVMDDFNASNYRVFTR